MFVIVYTIGMQFNCTPSYEKEKLQQLQETFPGYKILIMYDHDSKSDQIRVLDLWPPAVSYPPLSSSYVVSGTPSSSTGWSTGAATGGTSGYWVQSGG